MKLFNTCALCATLAVPALVQTVQAKDSVAEEFMTSSFELMEAFTVVINAIDEEEATPAEGAEAIAEINAAMTKMMEALPKLSDKDKAELAKLMEDKEIIAAEKTATEGLSKVLTMLKGVNYADCKELKAACEDFAKIFDIKY